MKYPMIYFFKIWEIHLGHVCVLCRVLAERHSANEAVVDAHEPGKRRERGRNDVCVIKHMLLYKKTAKVLAKK